MSLISLNVLLGVTFVCMSVPPHIENNLCVWMLHFISSLLLCGRDVDWCLDLCYLFWGWGGGGSVVLKMSFVWVWFYLEFLGDYFLLRGFFFINFFFCVLWWNFIDICSTFTHSFTQFFCVFGGSVSIGWCAFLFWGNNS